MVWHSSLMTVDRHTTVATVSPLTDSQKSPPYIVYVLVWSNFEIGNLDLWRGEAYSKFFDFLDQKGGFYYEVCEKCISMVTC